MRAAIVTVENEAVTVCEPKSTIDLSVLAVAEAVLTMFSTAAVEVLPAMVKVPVGASQCRTPLPRMLLVGPMALSCRPTLIVSMLKTLAAEPRFRRSGRRGLRSLPSLTADSLPIDSVVAVRVLVGARDRVSAPPPLTEVVGLAVPSLSPTRTMAAVIFATDRPVMSTVAVSTKALLWVGLPTLKRLPAKVAGAITKVPPPVNVALVTSVVVCAVPMATLPVTFSVPPIVMTAAVALLAFTVRLGIVWVVVVTSRLPTVVVAPRMTAEPDGIVRRLRRSRLPPLTSTAPVRL